MNSSNNDILSKLCPPDSLISYAFDPKILAFHNKVIALQKNCPMIEWEQDMGATIPFCKLDKLYCNGQCTFNEED